MQGVDVKMSTPVWLIGKEKRNCAFEENGVSAEKEENRFDGS